VHEIDSSIVFAHNKQLLRQSHADQAAFAAAVEETAFLPFVLPLNWNFRPRWQQSFFGPIKVWHDYQDLPGQLREIARYYEQPDAVIQYHRGQ